MGSNAHVLLWCTDRVTEEKLADYQTNKPGTFITWPSLYLAPSAMTSQEGPSETNTILDSQARH